MLNRYDYYSYYYLILLLFDNDYVDNGNGFKGRCKWGIDFVFWWSYQMMLLLLILFQTSVSLREEWASECWFQGFIISFFFTAQEWRNEDLVMFVMSGADVTSQLIIQGYVEMLRWQKDFSFYLSFSFQFLSYLHFFPDWLELLWCTISITALFITLIYSPSH